MACDVCVGWCVMCDVVWCMMCVGWCDVCWVVCVCVWCGVWCGVWCSVPSFRSRRRCAIQNEDPISRSIGKTENSEQQTENLNVFERLKTQEIKIIGEPENLKKKRSG